MVFSNKYLDWDRVNKWDELELKNISSVCNIKLTELTFLSDAGVERLLMILFRVRSRQYLQPHHLFGSTFPGELLTNCVRMCSTKMERVEFK